MNVKSKYLIAVRQHKKGKISDKELQKIAIEETEEHIIESVTEIIKSERQKYLKKNKSFDKWKYEAALKRRIIEKS